MTVVLDRALASVDAATPEPLPEFKLLSPADVKRRPRMGWRIKGVIPAQGCAAIYGPSQSAKSFCVTDMLAAVAMGRDWFGYKVKQGSSLHVVLEGQAGIPDRVRAWEAHYKADYPTDVRFLLDQPFRLNARDDVLGLAAAIQKAGGGDIIAIDTYAQATPGSDENAGLDSGIHLAAVRELQACTGGLVLLVAHTGKDSTKGMRGHSSVFAALDAVIETRRTGDSRSWRVEKLKDGKDGAVHPFRLRVLDLGLDDEGDPITSCAIEPETDDGIAAIRKPTGANQLIVYDGLSRLLRESNAFGRGGAPAIRPCVEYEHAVAEIKASLPCEPKRQAERTRKAITDLVSGGVAGFSEGWLWLR